MNISLLQTVTRMLGAGLTLLAAGAAANVVTLTAEMEKRVLPADASQDALVKISILAPDSPQIDPRRKGNVNLAVVLDRSGSMNSQEKMARAKDAAITAVQMLARGDIFSLIVYDDNVNTLVPATPVTEAGKEEIIARIREIRTGGSTALFAGVSVGANEVRKNARENFVNRIILLSDGLANVGPSSPQELGRLGASLIKEAISVSTVGVGSDYNEDLMTALSQNSDGNFYFVENSRDLPLIFSKELGSALRVAARSIRLKITCPEGVRPKGILGHECRINGNTIEMNFNQVYSGHEKALILQVEVPAKPNGASETIATIEMDYLTTDGKAEQRLQRQLTARYSSDPSLVAGNLNRQVQADIAVQKSAVMREQAVKQADAGNFDAAKKTLRKAADSLEQAAVAAGRPELKEQAKSLNDREAEMDKSKADADQYNVTRKRIKGESYQQRNSQMFIQK